MSDVKNKTIKFYASHNRKLECDYFTTIRPSFEGYYCKGEIYGILLGGQHQFNAEIIDIRKIHVPEINDWIAYLDAGIKAEELKALLKKMYPKKNLDEEPMYFILLKKIHVRTYQKGL